MTQPDLSQRLSSLIATWENEVAEFKQADNNYSTDEIGKYFSALANEANLRHTDGGWLVFGVSNKTRRVVGTDYRPQSERLQSLKMQIAENAEPRITFREIHELAHADGRVLMLEIPAAPQGIPIAWKGHYYARAGESLTSLGLDKLDDIRRQTQGQDWTAQVVAGATLDDLDEAAVHKARESFAQKYANRFQSGEVEGWSVPTFLDRARVTRNGQITRTALLLLGKVESTFHLSPYPAQLTWKLEGQERAYEHFGPPFLLSTTRLYQRIRNIQLRLLPQDELLPIEVSKYDQKIVLEALHNCLAHQDYTRNGRVVVTELPDRLVFENEGSFFEGQPDEYIQGDKTPRRYRNPALAQAMVELNMIDTMGYGIHSIYAGQARRYFPLPDYDLSDIGAVKLTIYGGVADPAYSRLLIQNTDLPLADILALDRVQKKLPIPDEAAARLRRSKLIEGRKPNFHVSAAVAEATANKADYIRTRAQDDAFYAKLLTDYLEKFGRANRAEINKLLMDKLSDALDDKQKYNKVSGLLTRLRRHGVITNTGSDTAPCWRLTERIAKKN
ncbi:putative DNA binding domain-containing protein [Burkholderia gladioli]|uniref:RNA-binding domain-containing protein n=1 Tax=Burkholderia gladioli TaxID=28095 RepID=UPI00163F50C0|nr:RNA-binding domain-containing protein [Burkholderia gladioli]MDN7494125.1 putative DNA binding domain-containing protein [Burkholderia gladioli]